MLNWQLIFRASTPDHFFYLSKMFELINGLLLKKNLSKKFLSLKQDDLNRLLNYEVGFKLKCSNWPFVPSSFR